MPIRRRSDGEVVVQPTRLVGRGRSEHADADVEEVRTELVAGPVRAAADGGLPDDDQTRLVRRRRGACSTDPMEDPPVGWLVVVKGPGRGKALTLGYGMNTIGRGPEARVQVDFGDTAIARANQSRLVYEPRERRYFLSHGDSANLTYLDGKAVMGPAPLASGAMIEVGATTLRFQALCSPDFDWSETDD